MRTFVQKQNQPQKPVSSNVARSHTATPGLHHRADHILHLQRTLGNQAVQRMLQTNAEELKAGLTGTVSPRFGHDFSRVPIHPPAAGAIQTKLTINKPGDEYEQEADRIAEQVIRMPEPRLQRACACGGGCPKCQAGQPGHEHERLQPKRFQQGNLGQTAVPPIVHEVLVSPGQPLDPATRSVMEQRFGHDFSQMPVFHKSPAVLHDNSSGPHAEMLRVQVLLGNRQFQQFFEGKPKKRGGKKPEPKTPPSRELCDNKCGTSAGGPYGSTECELDLKSGLLTGKVTKEVFDKNPCTRPCVKVHEGVHAKKIAPVCTAAKKCLDAAGGDFKKQNKCLDKFESDMNALTFSTECAAYTADEKCLDKRAKKVECRSTEGKKRWDEQMKMVKCYKGCFCKG